MAQGKPLDEATKEAIRADVRMMDKHGETKKQIAKRFGIHPTMISKIMNGKKPVKATTKRKTAKPARKPTEAEWEKAFKDFIMHRDAAVAEGKLAEVARKKLEKFVKELA